MTSLPLAASDSPAWLRDRAYKVCDGVADRAAIQEAIAASPVVSMAPGTYWLDGMLNVTAGCTLEGPRSAVLKLRSGYNANIDMVGLGDGATLNGLTVDGNRLGQTVTSNTQRGVRVDGVGASLKTPVTRVQDVELRNCGSAGVYISNSKRVVVSGLSAQDVGSFGGAESVLQLVDSAYCRIDIASMSIGNIGVRMVRSYRNLVLAGVIDSMDDDSVIMDDGSYENAVIAGVLSRPGGQNIVVQQYPILNLFLGLLLTAPSQDAHNTYPNIKLESGAYTLLSSCLLSKGHGEAKQASYGIQRGNAPFFFVEGVSLFESGVRGDMTGSWPSSSRQRDVIGNDGHWLWDK